MRLVKRKKKTTERGFLIVLIAEGWEVRATQGEEQKAKGRKGEGRRGERIKAPPRESGNFKVELNTRRNPFLILNFH